MSIRRFLGLDSKASTSAETQTVRQIVASLDAMDPQRARWIASFAFLLCRVARAELVISEEESVAIERILRETGGLSEDQAIMRTTLVPMTARAARTFTTRVKSKS